MNELAAIITIIAGCVTIIGGLYAFSRWLTRTPSQIPSAPQMPPANNTSDKSRINGCFAGILEMSVTIGIWGGMFFLFMGIFTRNGSMLVIGLAGLIIGSISFAIMIYMASIDA